VARRYGLYATVPTGSGTHELRLVIQGCLNGRPAVVRGVVHVPRGIDSRILVMFLVGTATATLCVRRAVWRYSRHRQYEQGIELRNVVVLGTNQLSYALSRQIRDHRRLGYRLWVLSRRLDLR